MNPLEIKRRSLRIRLNRSEYQAIADRYCQAFGLSNIPVSFNRRYTGSVRGRYFYDIFGYGKIMLKQGASLFTVIHELAHHLHGTGRKYRSLRLTYNDKPYFPVTGSDHGKEFEECLKASLEWLWKCRKVLKVSLSLADYYGRESKSSFRRFC